MNRADAIIRAAFEKMKAYLRDEFKLDLRKQVSGRLGPGSLPSGGNTGSGYTPAAHAGTHATGGSDELTPAAIGAVAEGDSRLTNARTPTGGAGGVLSGTYPNPTFAADMATQAELDALASTVAAITYATLHVPRVFAGWPTGDGSPSVGDHFGSITHTADVPMTLTQVVGYAVTPPTGSAATFDIERKRGGDAWTSIFSVLPTFAVATATPTSGTLDPTMTSVNTDDLFRLNWDAVNGLAGATIQLKAETR